MTENLPVPPAETPAPKKPYETPEVTTHGTIEDMTQVVPIPGSGLPI